MIPLAVLNIVIDILLWALLIWFAAWLNRDLKLGLRSVRWVAIYFLLSTTLGFITPIVLRSVVDGSQIPFGLTAGTFLVTWKHATGILRGISLFILVAIVMSELAPVLGRNSSVSETSRADPLMQIRARVTSLGYVTLALAVAPLVIATGILLGE